MRQVAPVAGGAGGTSGRWHQWQVAPVAGGAGGTSGRWHQWQVVQVAPVAGGTSGRWHQWQVVPVAAGTNGRWYQKTVHANGQNKESLFTCSPCRMVRTEVGHHSKVLIQDCVYNGYDCFHS